MNTLVGILVLGTLELCVKLWENQSAWHLRVGMRKAVRDPVRMLRVPRLALREALREAVRGLRVLRVLRDLRVAL